MCIELNIRFNIDLPNVLIKILIFFLYVYINTSNYIQINLIKNQYIHVYISYTY